MPFFAKSVQLLVLASVVVSASEQLVERTRVIPFSDRPIVERLLPDDQVVVLARDDSDRSVTEREPTASEIVRSLLDSRFGNLVIVDVNQISGVLVDDGRWIDTKFDGVLADVVTTRTDRSVKLPVKGAPISFSFDGGEVKVGNVLVRTNNAIPFPAKRRYLAFLGPPAGWGVGTMVAATEPVIIDRNKLRGMGKTHPPITSLTFENLLRLARQRR
ncbi:MAG: hypothetical protein K2Y23_19200 [Cyanobacteria bacterium]|nr:hypothetical protein [Cyanobacteriota bacterium]